MTLALWLVVAASAAHIVEEYLWPGGFLGAMRRTAPAFAFAVNVPMAVVINALFAAGVVAAAVIGPSAAVFALSAAALLSAGVLAASLILGAAYHLVPLGYFGAGHQETSRGIRLRAGGRPGAAPTGRWARLSRHRLPGPGPAATA